MCSDVEPPRQGVDENLHAVLRAHRAGDGRDHSNEDRGMGEWPLSHVTGEKRKRAIAVATSLFHVGRNSPVGCARATRLMQRKNRVWGSTGTSFIDIVRRDLPAAAAQSTRQATSPAGMAHTSVAIGRRL